MKAVATILIPTFDRPEYLRAAIGSAIAQTFGRIEIVVLDDGSNPETASVVEMFAGDARVTYVRNERNLGIAGNWSAGLNRVRSPYFCILHDDDTFEPTFVEELLDPLERDGGLVLAFSDHWVMNEAGLRMAKESEEASCRFLRHRLPGGRLTNFARSALVENSIPVGASLFRRDRVKPEMVREEAKGAVDAWLLFECVRSGHGAFYVPKRLMNYRAHSGGMSSSMPLHMGVGHVFRLREALRDTSFSPLHRELKRDLCVHLVSYGFALLSKGESQSAMAALKEALSLRLSFRGIAGYLLVLCGPSGTLALRIFRRLGAGVRWNQQRTS